MAQFGTGPRGESVGFKIGGLIEIERGYSTTNQTTTYRPSLRCEIAADCDHLPNINLKVNSRPVNQRPDLAGCLPRKVFQPLHGRFCFKGFGEADQSVIHKPI